MTPYVHGSFWAGRGFGPLDEINQEALKWCLTVAGMGGYGALWRGFGCACVPPQPPPKSPAKELIVFFQKTPGCQQGNRYVKSQHRYPQGWSISVKNPWLICVKSGLLFFPIKGNERMKRGFVAFLSFVLWLSNPFKHSAVLWAADTGRVRGEITLIEEMTVIQSLPPSASAEDNSSFAMTVTGTPWTFKSRKEVTFKVCIRDGGVLVSDTQHAFSVTDEHDYQSRYLKTDCTPIHRSRDTRIDIRRPGSWTQNTRKMTQVFLFPEKANKIYNLGLSPWVKFIPVSVERPKGGASGVVGGLAKGIYRIEASTYYLQASSGYMEHKIHNICKDTETLEVAQFFPSEFGKKEPSGQVSRLGNTTRTIAYNPFKKESLSAEWNIHYDPKGTTGSAVLLPVKSQNKEASYEKTVSAKWSFEPADTCQDLVEAILHDLAYAEAFQDPFALRQEPKRYRCYVDRVAYKILNGHWPTQPELQCDKDLPDEEVPQGVGDEIGVNGKCELINKTTYLEKAKRGCVPDEVVAGILAHENTHIEQCRRDQGLFNSDHPEVWRDMEVSAHLVGIAEMLKSLKQLCPNAVTAELEQRIGRINRYRLNP